MLWQYLKINVISNACWIEMCNSHMSSMFRRRYIWKDKSAVQRKQVVYISSDNAMLFLIWCLLAVEPKIRTLERSLYVSVLLLLSLLLLIRQIITMLTIMMVTKQLLLHILKTNVIVLILGQRKNGMKALQIYHPTQRQRRVSTANYSSPRPHCATFDA